MKTKILFFVLLGMVSGLLLVGCGPSNESPPAASPDANAPANNAPAASPANNAPAAPSTNAPK